MEYKGYEIYVRSGYVVLGPDPLAEPTDGFIADIRKKDPEPGPNGETVWDFPFGLAASYLQGATEQDVIEQGMAFIDAGGKRPRASSMRSSD